MDTNNRWKSSRAKWLTGYFIFLALILTINHFIELELDFFVFGAITLTAYYGIYAIKRHIALFIKLVALSLMTVLLIYALDYGLTAYMDQSNQDLVLQDGTQVLSPTEGESQALKRHNVTFVHTIRDFLGYEKAITFGKWVVNERIDQQVIHGKVIPQNKKYELMLLIVIALLMAMILGVVFDVKFFKMGLLLPIIFYVWLWYQFIDLPWIISSLYFGGACAFFIMDHHEKLLKVHPDYNNSYYPARKLMVTSLMTGLIVIIISGAVTLVFPIKQVNDALDKLTPNIWGARSGYSDNALKMYALSETAFRGNSGILGGPVGPLNLVDPIFWVKFDQKLTKAVYLKTSIKDKYDGLKWSNSSTVFKNDYTYYLSDPSNVELLKSGNYDLISGAVRINKKVTETVTLFTPMGLFESDLGSKKVYTSSENEAFYKAGSIVTYLSDYTFRATGRDFYKAPEVDYLQLTDRIEPRTYDLALTVGGLRGPDYDKMVVITDFLSRNYTYSLTPLSNFDRRDFVSEFLFESRIGYCTYFASTLAILARINGIPSRYVEGFRVDPNEVDPEGDYSKVTERDAHAWAEVYLEGYGWVIFESTPIYSGADTDAKTPTLEELLAAEAPETSLPNGETPETTKTPLDRDVLFPDEEGGPGTLGPQNVKGTSTRRILTVTVLVSLIALLVLGVLLFRRPITYLKRRASHAYAVRILYYLAYLTAESRDDLSAEPEAVFTRFAFPKTEVNLWLKVLYDRKENVSQEMVLKAIDTAISHIKTATVAYKLKKGKIAYLKLRAFKIGKLIP